MTQSTVMPRSRRAVSLLVAFGLLPIKMRPKPRSGSKQGADIAGRQRGVHAVSLKSIEPASRIAESLTVIVRMILLHKRVVALANDQLRLIVAYDSANRIPTFMEIFFASRPRHA